MSTFGGIVFTNKGKALQAKAQTGAPLVFTRIAVGDGGLGGQPIADLNSLISQVKSLPINKLRTMTGGKATVGGVLSNQGLTNGFYWRELGLFATDPDVGEILYCYGNAGGLAEYIPAGGGADILEKQVNIVTLIGNAPHVSASIDQSLVYVQYSEFQDAIAAVNNKADQAFQQANDGKINIASVVGSPVTSGDTFVQMKNKIQTIKDGMAFTLSGKGVPATASETLAALAGKIANIIRGSGNAQPGDVISGKTFRNNTGFEQPGTMPNNGAVTITPSGSNQAIPAGYHNGSGVVNGVSVPTANVLSGTTIAGQAGTMPNNGPASAETVTLTNNNQEYTVAAGYHSGLRKIKTVIANLVAGVIKAGENVGGVVGTFTSDATAAAADIRSGKTAYVNGSKVTGSKTSYPPGSRPPAASWWSGGGQSLYFYVPEGVYDSDVAIYQTDAELIPSNIVTGVEIFGVTGTVIPITSNSAGSNILATSGLLVVSATTQYVHLMGYRVNFSGSARFTISAKTSGGSMYWVYSQLYKNGAEIPGIPSGAIVANNSNSNPSYRSFDLPCNVGDTFSLLIKGDISGMSMTASLTISVANSPYSVL